MGPQQRSGTRAAYSSIMWRSSPTWREGERESIGIRLRPPHNAALIDIRLWVWIPRILISLCTTKYQPFQQLVIQWLHLPTQISGQPERTCQCCVPGRYQITKEGNAIHSLTWGHWERIGQLTGVWLHLFVLDHLHLWPPTFDLCCTLGAIWTLHQDTPLC